MNETNLSMPPPHEDRDCHRPAPRYVVTTKVRGQGFRFHSVFINDLEGALKEAADVADERFGWLRFGRRYERVEVWEGAGHERLICTWFNGRPQMARRSIA
jgi:hypothetical protein